MHTNAYINSNSERTYFCPILVRIYCFDLGGSKKSKKRVVSSVGAGSWSECPWQCSTKYRIVYFYFYENVFQFSIFLRNFYDVVNFDFFTSIIIFVFSKICVTSSWYNHQKCDGIFWFTKIVSIYYLQMGQSAFLISCVKGSFDIVKFLELKGSDIEIDTLVSHAAEW